MGGGALGSCDIVMGGPDIWPPGVLIGGPAWYWAVVLGVAGLAKLTDWCEDEEARVGGWVGMVGTTALLARVYEIRLL